MAQTIADRRDIDFVLYEQIRADELTRGELFAGFNRKTFDLIVSEARRFALKEILPTFAEGDRQGVRYTDGAVRVPDCYHRPYKLFCEGEWTSMTADPELGGQGLPLCVAQAASEYLVGANYAFTLYGLTGHAAGELIEIFGTPAQKEMFLKKMYTGKWAGTMQLTEPQAGSDVGALTTTAVKNDDGSYALTGNKIFITGGDHDLTENIIHPVLARIEGAPPGSAGISLFIVPKIRVNPDGSLGAPNDIVCTGIEEKMGIHGSATCAMALGGKGGCRGLLLGEPNKGMRAMFHMMNAARLAVGFIGFISASAAYLYALNYARERLQGKALEKMADPDAPQVPIVGHPDVRRMLIWMKAHVEGMRSLIYYTSHALDLQRCTGDPDERKRLGGLVDLLTPVIKSYCSDRGFEACVEALQVFGGYGYTRDYPVEQLLRDCKIASIYEGTNGIQAMDLLGRKLGMQQGAVFMNFLGEIQREVAAAKTLPLLAPLAERVQTAADRLAETAMQLGLAALAEQTRAAAFAHAKPFLDVMGDVCMAWMLLWRARIAADGLLKIAGSLDPGSRRQAAASSKDAAFYEGQIQTAAYFCNSLLPAVMGRMDAVKAVHPAAVEMPEDGFGG